MLLAQREMPFQINIGNVCLPPIQFESFQNSHPSILSEEHPMLDTPKIGVHVQSMDTTGPITTAPSLLLGDGLSIKVNPEILA